MLPISKGLLVTTDIPSKQLIIHLNKQNNGNIIVKDLDEHHVLINPSYLDFVKAEVDRIFSQNIYERKDQ